MILSDIDIKAAIADGRIILEPPPEEDQFTPSSLDLRLNDEFKAYDNSLLKKPGVDIILNFSEVFVPEYVTRFTKDVPKEADGSVIIKPGDFVLAQTYERIALPKKSQLAARVEGRSSGARLGLVVHLSAPTIHAGFSGKITLEIINHGPAKIRLTPFKDKICQLVFEQVFSIPSEKGRGSQFDGQETVAGLPKK
jgi:dCTP deaminase